MNNGLTYGAQRKPLDDGSGDTVRSAGVIAKTATATLDGRFWNVGRNVQHFLLAHSPLLAWLIIGVGVTLRLAHYLANRSLWLDESLLVLNIVHRSFSQLLQPLDLGQIAPIGFLLVEKLAVQTLGDNEYALRLFPLLSGSLSLLLFYKVAQRCVSPKAVLIGLGLMSLSSPLIYYSAEVKQYASDVMVALLLLWAALPYLEREELTVQRAVLLGILGALGVWLSHPAIFVLAGIGGSLTVVHLRERRWEMMRRFSIAYCLWALSFVASYFIFLRHVIPPQNLLGTVDAKGFGGWWREGSMPLLPKGVSDLKWFALAFFNTLEMPVGIRQAGIGMAALACILGCCAMLREEKDKFFVFTFPILFTLLASGLHKYHFSGRFLLFLVPSLVLLIAVGAEYVWERTRRQDALIGAALLGLLFLYPVFDASSYLRPYTREEIRPVISYVRENWEEGDTLYLSNSASFAFRYYQGRYGFSDKDYFIGLGSADSLFWEEGEDRWSHVNDLNKLRGKKRVWVLFSHVHGSEEELFLYLLDSLGTRRGSFRREGAAVYLYDLIASQDGQKKIERPNREKLSGELENANITTP